jgi:hypothetical protein
VTNQWIRKERQKEIGNVQSVVRENKNSLILIASMIAYNTNTLWTVWGITTTRVNVDTSIA